MDPIGQAIYNYYFFHDHAKLMVESNYTDEEEIDPAYFFRTIENMPLVEKKALGQSVGKILDIGAGAGCHSLELQKNGFEVISLEKSEKAAEVMIARGVKNVLVEDIYNFRNEKFDTILLLMNGAGIAGNIAGMKNLLRHLKPMLNMQGQILMDSADINYLFFEDDGSYWIDISSEGYYGEMIYTVKYKNEHSTTFPWLYVDFSTLKRIAAEIGFNSELIEEGEEQSYLAKLTISNILY